MPSLEAYGPSKDPRRPELPYKPELSLAIRRHVPPEPFGVGPYLKTAGRPMAGTATNPPLTHSEWCLQHPLLETPPPADQTVHRLRIIHQIACKDGRGAQIVRCQFEGDDSRVYVAKIYDPLYYFYHTEASVYYEPDDVTYFADVHYSREASSYEDLEAAGVDGVFSPKYYGSWTFSMPLLGHPEILYPVRMILIEYITGITLASIMQSGRITSFPPQHRLNIFAKILEADCKLSFYGVQQNDLAPRNVILCGEDIQANMPRVLLIDFNVAIVKGRSSCLFRPQTASRPVSPRYRFWGSYPDDFDAWVPRPHNRNTSVFNGWLKMKYENSKDFARRSEVSLPHDDYDDAVEMAEPLPDDPEASY